MNTMRSWTIFLALFFAMPCHGVAQWTILVYIEADNSLAPFATYNVSDMMSVGSTADVNILVQWDKPRGQGTYRYYVNQGSKTLVGQLTQPMGSSQNNQLSSLEATATWLKTQYPAQHYMYILWNHGNGVLDRSHPDRFNPTSWIQLPGLSRSISDPRGVLYDDTYGTYLATTSLRTAFASIAATLGQKVDVLGFDACLMAMAEVAGEVKDNASYMVGSQQTEPGVGWNYSGFLSQLVSQPTMSPLSLSQKAVDAYAQYYTNPATAANDFTLSVTDLSAMGRVENSLTDVVNKILAVSKINSATMLALASSARVQATSFYISSYTDLLSFYQALLKGVNGQLGRSATGSAVRTRRPAPSASKSPLIAALTSLQQSLMQAISTLGSCIVYNKAGSSFASANGMSIYYPTTGFIDSTYKTVDFIKDTPAWLSFLQFTGMR